MLSFLLIVSTSLLVRVPTHAAKVEEKPLAIDIWHKGNTLIITAFDISFQMQKGNNQRQGTENEFLSIKGKSGKYSEYYLSNIKNPNNNEPLYVFHKVKASTKGAVAGSNTKEYTALLFKMAAKEGVICRVDYSSFAAENKRILEESPGLKLTDNIGSWRFVKLTSSHYPNPEQGIWFWRDDEWVKGYYSLQDHGKYNFDFFTADDRKLNSQFMIVKQLEQLLTLGYISLDTDPHQPSDAAVHVYTV